MISDVLFDALQEIERYQKDLPECYDEMKDEIEQVKEVMRRLQRKLDAFPGPPNDGAFLHPWEGPTDIECD